MTTVSWIGGIIVGTQMYPFKLGIFNSTLQKNLSWLTNERMKKTSLTRWLFYKGEVDLS